MFINLETLLKYFNIEFKDAKRALKQKNTFLTEMHLDLALHSAKSANLPTSEIDLLYPKLIEIEVEKLKKSLQLEVLSSAEKHYQRVLEIANKYKLIIKEKKQLLAAIKDLVRKKIAKNIKFARDRLKMIKGMKQIKNEMKSTLKTLPISLLKDSLTYAKKYNFPTREIEEILQKYGKSEKR